MVEEAYVLLDSTRRTPQIIQHQIIRNFAKETDLKISFYGAEFRGFESTHMQLKQYIEENNINNFLLYSIYQFYEKFNGFDIEFLEYILSKKKNIFFAAEKISIKNEKNFRSLKHELKIAHINLKNKNSETIL